ncbi:MAG: PVC-type heme-binding CxxCH protein [Planctomycetota bacterium]
MLKLSVNRTVVLRNLLLTVMAGGVLSGWSLVSGQTPDAAGNGPATPDDYVLWGIYAQTAPRPQAAPPVITQLPLQLSRGDRIVVIGNTLAERSQGFGQFEAMLQQAYPELELVVRHLAWSGDEIGVQPRPDNFADTEQHLLHEQADVVVAMFGFNESFAGEAGLGAFEVRLRDWLQSLRTKSFNGKTAARVVLVGPPASENVRGVAAADLNNANLRRYVLAMQKGAREQQVGYVDVYDDTVAALESPGSDLTINGVHFGKEGDLLFSEVLFRGLFSRQPPQPRPDVVAAIIDRNEQFFRRFRPLNTFYYTGGRNRDYGYLDFLPAMRNFELMTEVRDRRIHDLAAGRVVPLRPDDSQLPQLPPVNQSRGANEWLSAADEQRAFQLDPRFEVNLFAGEEQFPEIANPIQMRWDSRGRLWVSCSTTYPHVYPGREPDDRLVILEDVDGDGRADRSTVFAEGLHLPLSFEFGDGGVFVSEQPQLTFLRDVDGDDRADERRVVLSGFGTEDSHHALHDFTWTPDGDLILRESIFHHTQVETPYGPVRQQNSGWFRWEPSTHRLVSFGSYPSTNPWGVTFDDWGQHTASHPVYAAAFQALDPPYPQQHPVPKGLQAYSGVCGQQFIDTPAFPGELQGQLIRVRYKPTNRVELLAWKEGPFGFEEEYVGDLLFSKNLSFIPVDLQFGPRGDLYVCDWYNPVKGHAQYSLRDERRDRHSGRIWRITAKGHQLTPADAIATATIPQLLELLKRREAAVRYRAKRELRSRDATDVLRALTEWESGLSKSDERYRHHQLEALWVCRWMGLAPMAASVAPVNPLVVSSAAATAVPRELPLRLLRDLLGCENHRARAAAVQQLRYWHPYLENAPALLRAAAADANGIVRMEAVIAASYLGTREAFEAARDVLQHPRGGHLSYALVSAFGSASLRRYWEGEPGSEIARMLKVAAKETELREPKATRIEAAFDRREGLRTVTISCLPERMLFSTREFFVRPGQPVKLVLLNADATDHNLVLTKPGALEEVGLAANAMAKDPRNAASDFVPPEKGQLILAATPLVGPSRAAQVAVLRFEAPQEPGLYPYVCTFPGHWIVMNGMMVVASSDAEGTAMLEAGRPAIVREWSTADFTAEDLSLLPVNARNLELGMAAFVKARCSQCHVAGGNGVNLGPDLAESRKTLKGHELLRQILEPSLKIHEKFQAQQFVTDEGRVVTGVVVRETDEELQIATDLLRPASLTTLRKSAIEERVRLTISAMPPGLLNGLTKMEIQQLLVWLEKGDLVLPEALRTPHGLEK